MAVQALRLNAALLPPAQLSMEGPGRSHGQRIYPSLKHDPICR
jgi:hypothetical protein